MNKKIAVGIVNCYDQDTFVACKEALPNVDLLLDVHHTTYKIKDVPADRDIKRYISYGGLYNILLRYFYKNAADYIFLIKSNIIIKDHSIFNDYINTAKIFGTYFMSRGVLQEAPYSPSTIEDEFTKTNLCLYNNLGNDLIFMHKSHIKVCGYMYEGYTNISGPDDTNILEVYDYYNKIKNKLNYLPEGYFPDIDLSLIKSIKDRQASDISRPNLISNTTNNVAAAYGKFHYTHNFIPGKHKKETRDSAFTILKTIQQIYSSK